MKLFYFLIFVSLCSVSNSSAQVFSADTATYHNLSSGTRIAKDSVWDEFYSLPESDQIIPLGFTMYILGHEMDTILIDQAGFWDESGDLFVGLWADLCDKGFGSKIPKSPVIVSHEGSVGNEILKLEWQNFGFIGDYGANKSCTDSGNVQIWIYENPAKIEMRFGKSVLMYKLSNFPTGIVVTCSSDDGGTNTLGIDLTGNPDNPGTVVYDPINQGKLNDYPKENTLYIFDFSIMKNAKLNVQLKYKITSKNISTIEKSSIIIFDSQGRILKQSVNSNEIDFSGLVSGVYFAHISINETSTVQKIMVP